MLVYGDRWRTLAPRSALADIAHRLAGTSEDELTSALIEAGELAQGLADAEFEAAGRDDLTEVQDAAMALAIAAARRLLSGGTQAADLGAVRALSALSLPATVRCKTPEGYAFYAVYPQAYAQAAATYDWDSPPLVIGLRSIGTSLGAMVAAACGGEVISVRPTGPPFQREVRISDRLRRRLLSHHGPFAIVDEGPGLSGSSFGGVADLLEGLGVQADRIVYMPSHPGAPGPQAAARSRARWSQARRLVRTLDDLAAGDPVPRWFEPEVGPTSGVEDLSAGAWRRDLPTDDWPSAVLTMERRKIRFQTPAGPYVARFAGLGRIGEDKLARARALFAAGYGPEPCGLRRGFLLERWVAGGAPDLRGGRRAFLHGLADYLAFRRDQFPARDGEGADLSGLREMARFNAERLCDPETAGRVDSLMARLDAIGQRRVHVDGRLHPWEWRQDGARLLKTDALDHSCGHDLVGAQDVAWDVAGACVEFDLSAGEAATLADALAVPSEHVPAMATAYSAFQGALVSMESDPTEALRVQQRRAYYADRLRRFAASR